MYFTFYIRLSHSLSIEETQYWMPSLLDLFGMWGAIASFLTTLSFGLVAATYNRRRSQQSFHRHTEGLSSSNADRDNKELPTFASLQKETQMDVRLFERDHFDENGRLIVTAQEFAIPTTVFGELRSFAIREHLRKRKAADLLHSWMKKRSPRKNRPSLAKYRPLSTTWKEINTDEENFSGSDESSPPPYPNPPR
jgi:hypothetical protein